MNILHKLILLLSVYVCITEVCFLNGNPRYWLRCLRLKRDGGAPILPLFGGLLLMKSQVKFLSKDGMKRTLECQRRALQLHSKLWGSLRERFHLLGFSVFLRVENCNHTLIMCFSFHFFAR